MLPAGALLAGVTALPAGATAGPAAASCSINFQHSLSTTNLTAEVKAGEKNVFTFDLKPEDPPAAKSKTGRPK